MASMKIDIKNLDIFKETIAIMKAVMADANVPQKHKDAFEALCKKYTQEYYLGDDGTWYVDEG